MGGALLGFKILNFLYAQRNVHRLEKTSVIPPALWARGGLGVLNPNRKGLPLLLLPPWAPRPVANEMAIIFQFLNFQQKRKKKIQQLCLKAEQP